MTVVRELLPDSARPELVRRPTVWNVAYGSNLDGAKLRGRGPDCRPPITPLNAKNVYVKDFELRFRIPAMPPTEPVMADAAPAKGKVLHGVAYELTREDYDSLCMSEHCSTLNLPASYLEAVSTVRPYDGSAPFEATIFQASQGSACPLARLEAREERVSEVLFASARYMKLICDGAEEAGLDKEYVQWLRGIPSARPIESQAAKIVCELAMYGMFSVFHSERLKFLLFPMKRVMLPMMVKSYVYRELAAKDRRRSAELWYNLALTLPMLPWSLVGAGSLMFSQSRVLFRE